MTACPDPSVLEAFIGGKLADAERLVLEGHLDGCSACATVLAELARMYGDPSTGSIVSPPPSLHSGTKEPGLATSSAGSNEASQPTPVVVGRYRLIRRLGYAAGLYSRVVDDLSSRFGPKDVRAARARARAIR